MLIIREVSFDNFYACLEQAFTKRVTVPLVPVLSLSAKVLMPLVFRNNRFNLRRRYNFLVDLLAVF